MEELPESTTRKLDLSLDDLISESSSVKKTSNSFSISGQGKIGNQKSTGPVSSNYSGSKNQKSTKPTSNTLQNNMKTANEKNRNTINRNYAGSHDSTNGTSVPLPKSQSVNTKNSMDSTSGAARRGTNTVNDNDDSYGRKKQRKDENSSSNISSKGETNKQMNKPINLTRESNNDKTEENKIDFRQSESERTREKSWKDNRKEPNKKWDGNKEKIKNKDKKFLHHKEPRDGRGAVGNIYDGRPVIDMQAPGGMHPSRDFIPAQPPMADPMMRPPFIPNAPTRMPDVPNIPHPPPTHTYDANPQFNNPPYQPPRAPPPGGYMPPAAPPPNLPPPQNGLPRPPPGLNQTPPGYGPLKPGVPPNPDGFINPTPYQPNPRGASNRPEIDIPPPAAFNSTTSPPAQRPSFPSPSQYPPSYAPPQPPPQHPHTGPPTANQPLASAQNPPYAQPSQSHQTRAQPPPLGQSQPHTQPQSQQHTQPHSQGHMPPNSQQIHPPTAPSSHPPSHQQPMSSYTDARPHMMQQQYMHPPINEPIYSTQPPYQHAHPSHDPNMSMHMHQQHPPIEVHASSHTTPTSDISLNPNKLPTVMLSNVPIELTAHEVQEEFRKHFPDILSADALLNSRGEQTGRVILVLRSLTSAKHLVELYNGGDLNGRVLSAFLESNDS